MVLSFPFAITFVTCFLLIRIWLHMMFFFAFLLKGLSMQAQELIRGTVYDSSRTYPLEAVSVMSTTGKIAITDIHGVYIIEAGQKDSIWFSYLGKPTMKFPVSKISNQVQFDIALQVPVQLKEITVRPPNYKLDSISNRKDYEKGFNFMRPNVTSMTSIGPMGAGIDVNELIRVFQFRKNRRMESFRQRLLQQERDRFIDHRFNKAIVRELTGIAEQKLEEFMLIYRPSYEFSLYTSDYDFRLYIKEAGEAFKRGVVF
jgi:hypothetical protein